MSTLGHADSKALNRKPPGDPVVRIQHFHCRGVASIPGQGAIPMPGGVAKLQGKKGGGGVFSYETQKYLEIG